VLRPIISLKKKVWEDKIGLWSKFLRTLDKIIILGFGAHLFFPRLSRVLKWALIFDERRGVTTAGHSPCTEGDPTLSSAHACTHALSASRKEKEVIAYFPLATY
jgi:hypothetical protein